jgi:hypothetical protein
VYDYSSLKYVKKWLNPLLRPYVHEGCVQLRAQHEQRSKPSKVEEPSSKVTKPPAKTSDDVLTKKDSLLMAKGVLKEDAPLTNNNVPSATRDTPSIPEAAKGGWISRIVSSFTGSG